MLAIDGPMVMKVDPSGALASIHAPVSRPPGSPPDPARNVSGLAPWTRPHVGMRRLRAAIATPSDLRWCPAGIGNRLSARAARTASAGAMGSRYWNPFTGHSEKKATGTAIHDTSSVSLHEASR